MSAFVQKQPMETAAQRPLGLIVITVLGLVQGIMGVLRALGWFQAGIAITGHNLIIGPLVGAVFYLRGGLVAVIALLYLLFAVGALMRQAWSWWVGLIAAVMNLLLVFGSVTLREEIVLALPWTIVPIALTWYLLSPAGRLALRRYHRGLSGR